MSGENPTYIDLYQVVAEDMGVDLNETRSSVWEPWGEQPETTALPEPGALRGDTTLSEIEKEIK